MKKFLFKLLTLSLVISLTIGILLPTYSIAFDNNETPSPENTNVLINNIETQPLLPLNPIGPIVPPGDGSVVEPDAIQIPFLVYRIGKIIYKGVKTYNKVAESYVENAIVDAYTLDGKDAGKVLKSWNMNWNSKNLNVNLTFGDSNTLGMEHILARHHPEYWTAIGIDTFFDNLSTTLTFFNPDLTIKNIESAINTVVSSPGFKDKYAQKSGSTTVYPSPTYTIVVSNSNGNIISFYPNTESSKASRGNPDGPVLIP